MSPDCSGILRHHSEEFTDEFEFNPKQNDYCLKTNKYCDSKASVSLYSNKQVKESTNKLHSLSLYFEN